MTSAQSTSGSSGASSTPSNSTTQEYTVRVPKDRKKKFCMMKFGSGSVVDFTKLGDSVVNLERENNLKEYKTANDLDLMPKFGAGSEFGRDLKEEARRKKYGIIMKRYNPDDQPWLMKVGNGKQAKKYKGVREGTISENTSYYIFTQCADGAFEAFPVQEWYNFAPIIKYKYLNSEEAEEEFSKRDKRLNYFNIMLKKRMKNEDKDGEIDEGEGTPKNKTKSKKKNKDLLLTDMDEWADFTDDEEDDDDDDDENETKDDEDKPKKSKKVKGANQGKRVKNAKQNSDDEAIEESDEGDFDDREVDYMSDTSSSSLSEQEEKEKYEEKGVAEEAGLRNILDSEAEDEEEEENKEDEDIDEEKERDEEKPPKEKRNESESSSSSSDSDSDIDKDEKITSALLMQKDTLEKKNAIGEKSEKGTLAIDSAKSLKRKAESDSTSVKKSRAESPLPSGGYSSEGITEEAIRRYLQRKPMTTKDLLQKFRSKKLNMTSEQMTHTIAQLLKRINPDQSKINKKLYLSLKKPE